MLRVGRFSELDEGRLKSFLMEDGPQTRRELAGKMSCAHETVLFHLHSIGFAEK